MARQGSYTYGKVPPPYDFRKAFNAEVPQAASDDYRYDLRGRDAQTAEQYGIAAQDSGVSADDLRRIVKTLAEGWEGGDEYAGDLASSFLASIGIEWI